MSLKRVGALSACSSTGRMARARRPQAKPFAAPQRAARRSRAGAARARARRGRRAEAASRRERTAPAFTRSMREEAHAHGEGARDAREDAEGEEPAVESDGGLGEQREYEAEEDGETLPLEDGRDDGEEGGGEQEGELEGPRPREAPDEEGDREIGEGRDGYQPDRGACGARSPRRPCRAERRRGRATAARSPKAPTAEPQSTRETAPLAADELGRVEGADDGALADDALALGDRPHYRLDRVLGGGELAGALLLVEEGVLHREAHDEARGESGEGPREAAIGRLRVDGVPKRLQRDESVEGISAATGLPSLSERSST